MLQIQKIFEFIYLYKFSKLGRKWMIWVTVNEWVTEWFQTKIIQRRGEGIIVPTLEK